MRNLKVEGIIIKRRNYNEADRMVTILTQDGYKIQVKAAGVRRISSRRASHIELLNHSSLTLYQTQYITMLTEAQTITSYEKIKSDLEKIGLALHMCELVDGLCAENEENRQVFNLFKESLNKLSELPPASSNTSGISALDYALPAEEAYFAGLADGLRRRDAGNNSLTNSEELLFITHEFEVELLTILGFWNRPAKESRDLDTQNFIENILERKLKSRKIFEKLS